MDVAAIINKAWVEALDKKLSSPEIATFENTDPTLEMYRSYLLESFFHTRENPFSQVLSASNFPRDQHDLFRRYIQHALGEVKHDLLAFNDFVSLGGSAEVAKTLKPLKATQSLIDYTFELARLSSPLRYLAYLYHVEHLPTQRGRLYMERLSKAGIPATALTFVEEHASVDYIHNKMMEEYVRYFCKDSSDQKVFIAELSVAMDKHFAMILGAVQRPI